MLQFLLDEHVAPRVAARLRERHPEMAVFPLAAWDGGALLGAADDMILTVAAHSGLTLVTYDVRTVPPLLKRWAESGLPHAGVVFVDSRTIPQRDVGALIRALGDLWITHHDQGWRNRVVFLTA